jgi:hypothetical protein
MTTSTARPSTLFPVGTSFAQVADLLGKDPTTIYPWRHKLPGLEYGLPTILRPLGKDGRNVLCVGSASAIDEMLEARTARPDEIFIGGQRCIRIDFFCKIATVGKGLIFRWLPPRRRPAKRKLITFYHCRFAPDKLAHNKPSSQHCHRNAINRLTKFLGRAAVIDDLNDTTLRKFRKWLAKSGYGKPRQARISNLITRIWRYADSLELSKKKNGCPYLPGNRTIRAFLVIKTQGPASWYLVADDAPLIAAAITDALAKSTTGKWKWVTEAAKELNCTVDHIRRCTRRPVKALGNKKLASIMLPAKQPRGGIMEKIAVSTRQLRKMKSYYLAKPTPPREIIVEGVKRRTILAAADFCGVPVQTVKTWLRRCPPLGGPLKTHPIPDPTREPKGGKLLTVSDDDLNFILGQQRQAKEAGWRGRWPKYAHVAAPDSAATEAKNGEPELTPEAVKVIEKLPLNGREPALDVSSETGPSDERNKFCYEEWQRGKTLKEIWVETKRHGEWEQLGDLWAIRGPIKAWARKHGLAVRSGQPGRPDRAK